MSTPQDSFPRPISDPESLGLPDTADDDSTANDVAPSPRESDGPDPAPLPGDREDGPAGTDEFGTTAEEQLRGEPLEGRLAREEPDTEGDVTDSMSEDEPVNPHLDSQVSMYDRDDWMEPASARGGAVGRLVEPDEGTYSDVDAEAFAIDSGGAGGGASAEELAMHEVTDEASSGIQPGRPGDGYFDEESEV